MVNGRPIRRGLRKAQRGNPIIKAGIKVGKRPARARARGRVTPPDQLGFFSGKALPLKSRKGFGSDFSVVQM